MIYFLTSSPFTPGTPHMQVVNHLKETLRAALPNGVPALFVCSDPDVPELTDRYAREMRAMLAEAGFVFPEFTVLDRRKEKQAAALVSAAQFIVLCGGHVPTQNAFFRRIDLQRLLRDFDGVLMGISAGSMNAARTVYAQPEEEGEAVDPAYQRFLPGLGITEQMILPHYQLVKDDVLDGLRLFEDITLPDSRGRTFYALPDGSYLLGRDGKETLMGEAWRIRDGRMEKIADVGDETAL